MNKLIFWGLCATLVFLPLPFGAVDEWAIFAFEGATFLLFILYLAGKVGSKVEDEAEEISPSTKLPGLLKAFLLVFLFVAIIQIVPLPRLLVNWLSPLTSSISAGFSSGELSKLGGGGLRTLSFSPSLSFYELIKYIFYFLFGYLAYKNVRTKKQVVIFVWVMLLSAIFQSFYGLAELLGGTERIFGYKKVYYVGSATGTYINRNHFSGFLEMIFPISIGYLLARANFFAMKRGGSLKEKIVWFSQERLQKAIVFGLISVIIGLGIFLSRSRTGIFIFFATIFLMAIALSVAGGKRTENQAKLQREKRASKIIRTVTLVILFSVILIGIRPIIERFSWASIERERRPIYFKNTMELIKSFPLNGSGLGTYIYAYPMFEKKYQPGLLDHAHNDYLELLAESGMVGGASLILFAFGAAGYLFERWSKRHDYFVRGVVLGCLGGIVALLIHSLTDFNLHIPANAVYFVTLFALGMRTVKMAHHA